MEVNRNVTNPSASAASRSLNNNNRNKVRSNTFQSQSRSIYFLLFSPEFRYMLANSIVRNVAINGNPSNGIQSAEKIVLGAVT